MENEYEMLIVFIQKQHQQKVWMTKLIEYQSQTPLFFRSISYLFFFRTLF